MRPNRRAFIGTLLALTGIVTAETAVAAWPEKPLRIIVTYAAGGGNDVVARLIAEKLTGVIGQQVIVENKPGAGGNIGTDFVAKSAPDGYTIVLVSSPPFSATQGLYDKLSFDPVKDFAPIMPIAIQAQYLLIYESVPAKTFAEFIAYAKANPGKLNYASPGFGTPHHLGMEFLKQLGTLDIVHVPYRGAAPMLADIATGQVQVAFFGYLHARQHVESGKLRVLAVGTPARRAERADIATIAESGYPSFDNTGLFALFAPAATPRDIVQRLNTDVGKVLEMPDVIARLSGIGLDIVRKTPDEFARQNEADVARWTPVLRQAGIKAE